MRLFRLLVSSHRFHIGWQSFLAGLFPLPTRRADIRDLPPYLLRDTGVSEHCSSDQDRLLR